MIFLIQTSLVVACLTTAVFSSSPAALLEERRRHTSKCSDIVIPVTISASNLAIPITVTNGVPDTINVQGTYNIGARYCEPTIERHHRVKTLQILVHGITYTRNYWSGGGPPDQAFFRGDDYSWIAYAASEGYPTLSIDRLGNGISDQPDPTLAVQVNSEVETIHQVILKARSGQLPGRAAGVKFKKIIYVGHSYGSLLGNRLTASYPSDVTAAILTGWTSAFSDAIVTLLLPALAPAALVDPARFSTLDPGFFEINSTTVVQQLFYYHANYDLHLFNRDYQTRGTISAGEAQSGLAQAQTPAPSFTGPVLLIAGQRDNCFCPVDPNGPNCGTGWSSVLTESTQRLYPAAKSFDGYSLPNTGHCWNYHYRARLGFKIAHDWLDSHAF